MATTTRAPFLTAPYSAYHHREIPQEDAELTHVGPGTPCGEWYRRFWLPVYLTEDLGDLPRRIRILGEDLVIFKDQRGNIGLMELQCTHRGSSLEFGIIEERGIRCCYHGWLYATDGTILETPGEGTDSTLKDRLRHGSYPVREYKGLVFAYMGPPDKKPAFHTYDTLEAAGRHPEVGSTFIIPCNWLQVKENSMDPVHLVFLHTILGGNQLGAQVSEDFGKVGEIDFMYTPIGMVYIDSRRVGNKVWTRIADYMPPAAHQFPPSGEVGREDDFYGRPDRILWAVPIDDTHTRSFALWYLPEGKHRTPGPGFGQTEERPYEERQRQPGDYDAQVTQRSIAIHGMEHLATSDRGVIMFRNLVRQGIRAVEQGQEPLGVYHQEGQVVSTFCSDTMVEVPPAATPEEDRQLVRATGRKIAEAYVNNPGSVAEAMERQRKNGVV